MGAPDEFPWRTALLFAVVIIVIIAAAGMLGGMAR